MIDYKKKLVKELSKNLKLEEDIIENLIEVPKEAYMGDFTLPCFKLVDKIEKSPIIIARELKEQINSIYFERTESVGAYLNFFIDKTYIIKEILKSNYIYKKNSGEESKSVVIEYYGINMDKISAIERVFLEISMQSLKRVFENQGYKIEYPNNMNEENNEENIKNIIEDFKAKNLVTYENGCEVILLDKYNMPPYIISNEGKINTINATILNKATRYNRKCGYHKNIYIINSSQYTHFKQLVKILEVSGYGNTKNYSCYKLGIVKILENNIFIRKDEFLSLDSLIEKFSAKILNYHNINGILYDSNTINKIVRDSIVFYYINNSNKKTILFELDKIISYKEKNYIYVLNSYNRLKLLCGYLNENEEICNLNKKLLNEESKLIKILEDFPSVLNKCTVNLDLSILSRYIIELINVLNDIYKALNREELKLNKEKVVLIKSGCKIIKNTLDLIGIELL